MIVMKFGGSSVKDAERIRYVVSLIEQRLNQKPIIVFSAMGKTTDGLLEAGRKALVGEVDIAALKDHHFQVCQDLGIATDSIAPLFDELLDLLKGIALIKEFSPKTSDYLVSFGERLSVRVISGYLNLKGIKARSFDGWETGIITDSNFIEAEVLPETYDRIAAELGSLKTNYTFTPIVTGFIAKDTSGSITTLGRGGSDLTAALLGSALEVEEIQVWKDVDGILTCDPRVVSAARPVPEISFEEASELAYFGAKVLHPLSIQPAMARGIPVRVKNSYNPEHPGSVIVGESSPSPTLVKTITCKRDVTLVDIVSTRMLGQFGFLAKVFQSFNENKISVDMVATSEVSVSLTLNSKHDLTNIEKALSEIARVNISRKKALLSLIGDVKHSSSILRSVFTVLADKNINVQMISQGASKVNIGFIVEDSEVDNCIKALHAFFFEQCGAKKEAA